MKAVIGIVIFFVFSAWNLYPQSRPFLLKPASFSSNLNDEFSPVLYQGNIVFCSNERDNSLISYKNEQRRFFKIYIAEKTDSMKWGRPLIFSREITSGFNDGPATFTKEGNIIYFSRNNAIDKSNKDNNEPSNKLGIYTAESIEGKWTAIQPFIHNNPLYTLSTPSLSPEGDRLYFSSDMPDGQGGLDLYYCDRKNDQWEAPINLGPDINTPGNESFPFAGNFGRLYFSSDSLPGFGGMDLFYTSAIAGKWMIPVHMDSLINTPSDDFGIVTDSTGETGFFSSNRRKTDDIFSFSKPKMEFSDCQNVIENKYCFTFYDENYQFMDTIAPIYRWFFDDGTSSAGIEAEHCFPGAGTYTVKLNITDGLTGELIIPEVEYNVELSDIEQAYIHSDSIGMVDQEISFDALQSNLNDFNITEYYWNFGDGFTQGPPQISTTFHQKGNYTVLLGLLGEKEPSGIIPKTCVKKQIKITD